MPDPRVRAVLVDGRRVTAEAWDEFALRCDASFRSTNRHIRGWVLKRGPRSRLRRYEVLLHDDGAEHKIGQVAVGCSRRGNVFLDRLLLLPEHEAAWGDAMSAVLRCLPSGEYTYGWELNLEPMRQEMLDAIPGVAVRHARPIIVEAVDFASWTSWEDYYRSLSTNVRRNVKKAETRISDLAVVVRRGHRSLRLLRNLVKLRLQMYKRKGLPFDARSAVASALANAFVGGSREFIALATGAGKPLAAFRGTTFGRNTYYHDGGSEPENHGAAWLLMVEMLSAAYERDPMGRFVMGYVDPALHQEQVGGGLLRSRRSCRTTDFRTSIVTFSWEAPPDGQGSTGVPSTHVLSDQMFPSTPAPNAVTGP